MSNVTQVHEERETLAVEVNIPGHDPRSTTALFTHSKKALVEREGGRCYICHCTEQESGHPLEAHHYPVERSLATAWDWPRFVADCKAGGWGPHAQAFDWDGFMVDAKMQTIPAWTDEGGTEHPERTLLVPVDPYKFVDDMRANGMLLCKDHHTGKDEGIHMMPWPLWIWQRYAPDGYQLSDVEIEHQQV